MPKRARQEGRCTDLIGKVKAVTGQRDALAAVLLEGTRVMPGSQASPQASLSLPAVQAAIAKGRPMIAGFRTRMETVPIGAHGLPKAGLVEPQSGAQPNSRLKAALGAAD